MTPDIAALVERLRANADPRCYYHSRILASEAADALTRLSAEVGRTGEAGIAAHATLVGDEIYCWWECPADDHAIQPLVMDFETARSFADELNAALAPASSEGEG